MQFLEVKLLKFWKIINLQENRSPGAVILRLETEAPLQLLIPIWPLGVLTWVKPVSWRLSHFWEYKACNIIDRMFSNLTVLETGKR